MAHCPSGNEIEHCNKDVSETQPCNILYMQFGTNAVLTTCRTLPRQVEDCLCVVTIELRMWLKRSCASVPFDCLTGEILKDLSDLQELFKSSDHVLLRLSVRCSCRSASRLSLMIH